MIILVSGGIAVGKSAVANGIAEAVDGRVVRIRQALAEILDVSMDDRRQLQIEGAELDRRTQGRWLLHYIQGHVDPAELVVVDALRTRPQTLPLLDELPETHLIHLIAHAGVRRERYALAAKIDRLKAGTPYDVAVSHETERAADEMQDLASLALATDDLTIDAAVGVILDFLGLTRVET